MALNLLLKASDKKVVEQLFDTVFRNRNEEDITAIVDPSFLSDLELTDEETADLLNETRDVVKHALRKSPGSLEDIASGLPSYVTSKPLAKMVTKIMFSRMTLWRDVASRGKISLPRLLEFDWRVDLKSSSAQQLSMSKPTAIINLLVQQQCTTAGEMPENTNVNFEMSKDSLDAMLAGLGAIRDQLNSVSGGK
eukprot:INCI16607.1.p1 GENE.INCI16607.1~~INCI16607.1.p1  ORF type:complete len:194 (-),score=38.37 INCI16607.1:281-862(-)